MPELAEVETCRLAVEELLVGHRIEGVVVAADPIVVKAHRAIAKRVPSLVGRKLKAAGRIAKYLYLDLDSGDRLLVHLGMSGVIHVRAPKGEFSLHLKRGSTLENRAKFVKLELDFKGGGKLVFEDPRRFGRLELLTTHDDVRALKGLGYDVLNDPPPLAAIREAFAKSRRPLKAWLLDQAFFAGVGNWLADEILYDSRLAPARPANGLDDSEIKRLRASAIRVVKGAVKARSNEKKFPSHWLFHARWDGARGHDSRGYELKREDVAGRTTVWAPALQV